VIPNPFSGTMSYSYKVSGGGQSVGIGVYDMAGRLVRTLASGWQAQGQYTVKWDSRDNNNAQMAPGSISSGPGSTARRESIGSSC